MNITAESYGHAVVLNMKGELIEDALSAVRREIQHQLSGKDVVDLVLAGIRVGEPIEGICRAVARCGEILAHPLPPDAEPIDEIPHRLILED